MKNKVISQGGMNLGQTPIINVQQNRNFPSVTPHQQTPAVAAEFLCFKETESTLDECEIKLSLSNVSELKEGNLLKVSKTIN